MSDNLQTGANASLTRAVSPRRGLARRAAFSVIPVALLLAALEIGFRIAAPEPVAAPSHERPYIQHDPRLGWRHIPGARATAAYPGIPGGFEVTINAAGGRDTREYSKVKENRGAPRILVLGDSFSFGHGVDTEDSWPAALRRIAPGVETLNFAHQAYGLDQMALLYEADAREYEADAVIVALIADDLRRCYLDRTTAGYFKPRFTINRKGELAAPRGDVPPLKKVGEKIVSAGADNWLLRHSRLARYVRDAMGEIAIGRDGLELPIAILERLLGEIAAAGSEALVVFLPDNAALRGNDDAELARRRLQEACDAAGVDLLDLTPDFLEAGGDGAGAFRRYFEPGGHYNEAGQEFAARMIARQLAGRGIHEVPGEAAIFR